MTALPLRDFSAAEQAHLAAIEAAPAAAESVTERVARELYRQWREESGGDPADLPEWERLNEEGCDDDEPDPRGEYRKRAAALIAVLRGPSSDGERAVERVLECTYASDDGSEYEHDHGIGDGYPECPACWAEDIRRAVRGD